MELRDAFVLTVMFIFVVQPSERVYVVIFWLNHSCTGNVHGQFYTIPVNKFITDCEKNFLPTHFFSGLSSYSPSFIPKVFLIQNSLTRWAPCY